MTLALAPSAMNTVEKPSTNKAAASTVSRRTRGSGSRVRQTLQRGAGQEHQIGRYQREHARGEEADHAGNQGGQQGDIAIHGA